MIVVTVKARVINTDRWARLQMEWNNSIWPIIGDTVSLPGVGQLKVVKRTIYPTGGFDLGLENISTSIAILKEAGWGVTEE